MECSATTSCLYYERNTHWFQGQLDASRDNHIAVPLLLASSEVWSLPPMQLNLSPEDFLLQVGIIWVSEWNALQHPVIYVMRETYQFLEQLDASRANCITVPTLFASRVWPLPVLQLNLSPKGNKLEFFFN
ncbi:hypothetical protein ERO13_A10G130050v2 [Gossypium hirsutum]|uniref:Uncharacterized protein n=1 Tax=Gossypium darwinii TaxID=34276 RepID=A0A5D2F0Z6_GOSDA|nr:hypothetical protein ERO13_A10G130050v2 [Gossypium hirsutum]TYG98919.1 hypothetical protein ES288_A10G155700v1 [Gossypium darwinii]